MFKMKVDLTKDPILKSLLIFAFPLFVANVFQQLYNTMDTMIVGNFLGDTSLAAIGACGAIYELLVGFALGVGNGLSIVTARSFGAKDENLLKKSVAGSIVIGILLTIILMLFSQFCLYPLLELLNTPANIINEAYDYIFMITIFVGVMFAYNLCAGLLRAIGNSVMPLVFLLISSVLNVGLDLLFILIWEFKVLLLQLLLLKEFRQFFVFIIFIKNVLFCFLTKSILKLAGNYIKNWQGKVFRWD